MSPPSRSRTTSDRGDPEPPRRTGLLGAAFATVAAKLERAASLLRTGAERLGSRDPIADPNPHAAPARDASPSAPPSSSAAADAERIRAAMDLAVEVGNVGLWDANLHVGTYRYNSQLHAIYGLPDGAHSSAPAGEDQPASQWMAAVPDEDMAAIIAAFEVATNERRPVTYEHRLRRPSGEVRRVRSVALVLRDGDGPPHRAIGTTLDITEERELGATLQRAKDAADEANRAKTAFLANMSHEIRTPMNGVLGMAELVLDSELTAQQRELVSTIHASAESLLVVLNDILDFSKIEAGKLDVEPFDFEIRPALETTLKPLGLRALRANVALAHEVAPDVPALLHADWNRIRQILVNLVGNAVKFTSSGRVDVRVDTDATEAGPLRLRVVVSDTGIGIASERLADIFRPFEQGDPVIHARFGGSGLGLSISRQLVELIGGELSVTSEVGQGSTFTFTLPFDVAAPASIQSTARGRPLSPIPPPLDEAHDRRLSVLVAEDNVVNQRVIRAMLERRGHRVEVAADGAAAVRAALAARFDVVLMDIEMPEVDGLEATAKIRASEHEGERPIPIIALTAHAMAGDRERFLAAGIDDYLTKPLRADVLLGAVERLATAARSRA